jgi:hypothetical protein
MKDDLAPVTWRKSTFSNDTGACVEVASFDGGVRGVRDSKDPDGAHLTFTAVEWSAFTAGLRGGQFD